MGDDADTVVLNDEAVSGGDGAGAMAGQGAAVAGESSARGRRFRIVVAIAIVVLIVVLGCAVRSWAKKGSEGATAPAVALSQGPTESPTPTEDAKLDDFDWDSLEGMKLSNAYATLEYNGIDRSDLAVSYFTDDGQTVVSDANWTVTKVERNGNKVMFHLTHDSNSIGSIDPDEIGDKAKEKANDAYNWLSSQAQAS
ncbi:MAG: hypothetical protein PUF97_05740 [Bifidobacteriaceae bacterium]|nr:hypothetical protein [Bifidobacteriaceae bacterium]